MTTTQQATAIVLRKEKDPNKKREWKKTERVLMPVKFVCFFKKEIM